MMLVQKDRLILTDEKQKELLSNYLDSFCLCELYEDDGCSQLLIAVGCFAFYAGEVPDEELIRKS